MTAIVLGGFISGVFLLCWSIPTLQLCNAFHILFVRAGGKLWRVDLQQFLQRTELVEPNPPASRQPSNGMYCVRLAAC